MLKIFTMKYPRKKKNDNKEVPLKVKREIKKESKVESGSLGGSTKQGTKLGTLIRKIGKNKYGRKLTAPGGGLKLDPRHKFPKPKLESVETVVRKFNPDGTVVSSKTVSAKSKDDLNVADKNTREQASVKSKYDTSDVGNKEFSENKRKLEEESKNKESYVYTPGERSEAMKEKKDKLRALRKNFIQGANGNERKGRRKLKKFLIDKKTKEYLESKKK